MDADIEEVIDDPCFFSFKLGGGHCPIDTSLSQGLSAIYHYLHPSFNDLSTRGWVEMTSGACARMTCRKENSLEKVCFNVCMTTMSLGSSSALQDRHSDPTIDVVCPW